MYHVNQINHQFKGGLVVVELEGNLLIGSGESISELKLKIAQLLTDGIPEREDVNIAFRYDEEYFNSTEITFRIPIHDRNNLDNILKDFLIALKKTVSVEGDYYITSNIDVF